MFDTLLTTDAAKVDAVHGAWPTLRIRDRAYALVKILGMSAQEIADGAAELDAQQGRGRRTRRERRDDS